MKGVQEWLSFYFKSPMTAPGLYPEHDVFIQLMKLKNTLRHLRGEDLITHLGLEYYDLRGSPEFPHFRPLESRPIPFGVTDRRQFAPTKCHALSADNCHVCKFAVTKITRS